MAKPPASLRIRLSALLVSLALISILAVFAVAICYTTVYLMGRGNNQTRRSTLAIKPQPTTPPTTALPPIPAPRPAALTAQAGGIDVLASLKVFAIKPYKSPSINDNLSVEAALQKSQIYPIFSVLSTQTDSESLFEAFAWAYACGHGYFNDQPLRCQDPQLKNPEYADKLLLLAAGGGQPGAILLWPRLHTAQWTSTPVAGGEMLSDRLIAMAAQGSLAAMETVRQLCGIAGACQNPELTRNTLLVIETEMNGNKWPAVDTIHLEGTSEVQQHAVVEAEQIEKKLPLFSTLPIAARSPPSS